MESIHIGLGQERGLAFLQAWRTVTLENRLAGFVDQMNELLQQRRERARPAAAREPLSIPALQSLFDALPEPLAVARNSGYLCDPWAVASLKRDEVRNSSVLAWYLNPRGSHGFGGALLQRMLGRLTHILPGPRTITRRCCVQVETHPDGDSENRIDIQLDDEGFLIIVEVKIGAPESVEQLQRYAARAQVTAARRRLGNAWALVSLTPRISSTAVDKKLSDKLIRLTWHAVADDLDACIRNQSRSLNLSPLVIHAHQHFATLLARRFSQHIRNFK